jgi:hypothetical protein
MKTEYQIYMPAGVTAMVVLLNLKIFAFLQCLRWRNICISDLAPLAGNAAYAIFTGILM